MKYPRNVLLLFAVLDALLLLYLMPALMHFPLRVLVNGKDIPVLLWFLFTLSLGMSAIGLGTGKKWGLVVSYAQFPFRFVFHTCSFAFITDILAWSISGCAMYRWTMVAGVLECGRLLWTILIHRRLFRRQEQMPFSAALSGGGT